ncbi:hypothetical protein [Nocardia aurantiaca]|uniref:Uncharacterized protein n=1 Tax=Nocardia aurantiaca TaxID=2675850 RepID=A0A6I3L8G5_9NOCA|nr:hypothetical protein [Nocardia aurantiaca]MTE17044.1 hypothetical protein [Nocardia aurantiaca]
MTEIEFEDSPQRKARKGFGDRSPIGVAWTVFQRLTDTVLPADPRPVPLPAGWRARTWGQLREVMLDPALPGTAADPIWEWLIGRARARRPDATVMCASLAAPMLAAAANTYARYGSADREDVEAEILLAFLTALRDIDLDRPKLWGRLAWTALHAGWQWSQRNAALVPVADPAQPGSSGPMVIPPGHPELVLAEAVAAGVITVEGAELIAATRWERRTVTRLAADPAYTQLPWQLRKLRRRSELALAAWLAERARDESTFSSTEVLAFHALPAAGESVAAEPTRGSRTAAAGPETVGSEHDPNPCSADSAPSGQERICA